MKCNLRNCGVIDVPVNCEAKYEESFLSKEEADVLFKEILEGYPVTCREINLADGTIHEGALGSYVFSDEELTSYDKIPEAFGAQSSWSESLGEVRERIAQLTGTRFQVARAIYYENGATGMDFHQDYPAYGETDQIASLSLGGEREFVLRPLDPADPEYRQILKHGSLFLMGKHCQDRYQHGVPERSEDVGPRINLTFRKFGFSRP